MKTRHYLDLKSPIYKKQKQNVKQQIKSLTPQNSDRVKIKQQQKKQYICCPRCSYNFKLADQNNLLNYQVYLQDNKKDQQIQTQIVVQIESNKSKIKSSRLLHSRKQLPNCSIYEFNNIIDGKKKNQITDKMLKKLKKTDESPLKLSTYLQQNKSERMKSERMKSPASLSLSPINRINPVQSYKPPILSTINNNKNKYLCKQLIRKVQVQNILSYLKNIHDIISPQISIPGYFKMIMINQKS